MFFKVFKLNSLNNNWKDKNLKKKKILSKIYSKLFFILTVCQLKTIWNPSLPPHPNFPLRKRIHLNLMLQLVLFVLLMILLFFVSDLTMRKAKVEYHHTFNYCVLLFCRQWLLCEMRWSSLSPSNWTRIFAKVGEAEGGWKENPFSRLLPLTVKP